MVFSGKKTQINLLAVNQFEKSRIGRVVAWALTVGRYIVIFTELIVILAFLSRFYLDRRLTDLNEEIKQKQAVIKSFSELETQVNSIHQRTAVIASLLQDQLLTSSQLNKISRLTPPDVAFTTLRLDKSQVQLEGKAQSKQGIAGFLKALKTSPDFSNLNLDSLSSGGKATELTFALQAGFKEGK